MNSRPRLTLFSIVASIAYTLSFYFDWPLFSYYPLAREFHFGERSSGFPILWYGWLATAAIAGAVAAFAVPKRWAARLPPDLSWFVLIVLIVAVLVYEKRWFSA